MSQQITVLYTSIDNCRSRRKFKTIEGARKFAQQAIGEHPEIGRGYAVSGDGIGKIQVAGVTLLDLFPSQREASETQGEQPGDEDYLDPRLVLDRSTPSGRRGYLPALMSPAEKLEAIRELPFIGVDGRLKVYRWYPSEGTVHVDLETGHIDL